MKYTFQFTLFGKKVRMFAENGMGIVIEKEPDVICVYGTTENHEDILCAVPLRHPKALKGAEYSVEFSQSTARITVGDLKLLIDFEARKCANNKNLPSYGSDAWGQDVSAPWDENKLLLFK